MPGSNENGGTMLEETLTVVLAEGPGSRLQPLTAARAKPAIPFGGKYRIIDFTLANCLHSGLRRVLVVTQYKSLSLQKHLRDGWSIFNPELGEYITPVPPQMRTGEGGYRGTADAVYQNLYLLERSGARWVVILSGDHIYRMDYAAMLAAHRRQRADLTIAARPASLGEARGLAVLQVDSHQRVTGISHTMHAPPSMPEEPGCTLTSMGIYIFSIELLLDSLREDHARSGSGHDFGKDILPGLINTQSVYAYRFGGEAGRVTPDRYWRDVPTLDSYYEANMDLLKPVPALNLYQDDWPIRTYQRQTPPARTVPGMSGNEGIFINSIVGGGVVIAGGSVQHSVLFPRVLVGDEAVVDAALLFDGVAIGDGARVKSCIIDKHVTVPAGERIGYDLDQDRRRFTVTEKGIVVVPRGFRFQ